MRLHYISRLTEWLPTWLNLVSKPTNTVSQSPHPKSHGWSFCGDQPKTVRCGQLPPGTKTFLSGMTDYYLSVAESEDWTSLWERLNSVLLLDRFLKKEDKKFE